MKLEWKWLAVILLPLASPLAAQEYKVTAGDALMIRVLNQENLSNSYTVSPDRRISFPLIGNVPVADLTIVQVQEEIAKRLADGYFKNPVVTVSLEKTHSRRFFVYGEVKTPGEFPLAAAPIKVMQAISLAGGLTKSAKDTRVRILHPKEDDSGYTVVEIDIRNVIATGDGDATLQNNDILVVRQGWF
ncbi:MAG: polysaccharide export protein [Elusimicrobia bacterium]|nr:polysaccharide export protein [Elusimicrobiota bacterium]